MACPKCGCKVHYQYDGGVEDHEPCPAENLERCAACGAVFDIEDAYDEYDEDTECDRCHGDGRDPWNDYLLPCPACGGSDVP